MTDQGNDCMTVIANNIIQQQMIRLITSPSSKNDAGQALSPDAAFAQATGPEHPGRLHTGGCGATITVWYKKSAPPSLQVTQLKNTIQCLSNQVEIMKSVTKSVTSGKKEWRGFCESNKQTWQLFSSCLVSAWGPRCCFIRVLRILITLLIY